MALGRAACAGPAVPGALCRELPLGTGCAESNQPCAEWILLSAEARIPVVEQLMKRNRGEIRVPKGITLAPLYMSRNLFQLLHLAILMKKTEGDVYLMRMGSLLCDAANFGLAISTGFMVQNMMILVTVPKLKDGDDVMQ
jgi:hypothetical protein